MALEPIPPGDLDRVTERMRRLAAAVLGNEHDAEDAAQEAWIRALHRDAAPRDRDAWLAGVARNVARERRRASRRRRARERQAARPEAAPSQRLALDHLDALGALVQVVRRLEEPYRSALILRHVVGLSAAETAEALDCNPATLRSHVRRGLARVRADLDGLDRSSPASWRSALVPLAGGMVAPISKGVLVSKSKSGLLVALAILLAGVTAVWIVPPVDPAPPDDAGSPSLQAARAEGPALQGLDARAEGDGAPRSPLEPATQGPSNAAPAARFRVRARIQVPASPVSYDHGASWVYAIPALADAAHPSVAQDGVRAPWRKGRTEVPLDLPGPGPWLIGVNTNHGVARIEGIEVEEGIERDVLLTLPDPEQARRADIRVVLESVGLAEPGTLEAILFLRPKAVTGRRYSAHPREGEHPHPRTRTVPLSWTEPTDVPCHGDTAAFELSVALRSGTGSPKLGMLVGPQRIEAAPGETVHFRAQPAGTLLVTVTRPEPGLPLPRITLASASPEEAPTAAFEQEGEDDTLTFRATPGVWDVTWAGPGWEPGALRSVVVRSGTLQVQQIAPLQRAPGPTPLRTGPRPARLSAVAEQLRATYPLSIAGLATGPEQDGSFSVYAVARDPEDRAHVVGQSYVEVERDGDLLPVEELSSVTGLDGAWKTLEAISALRLPWQVARLGHAVVQGRAESLTFERGGFLVAVPSRCPRSTTVRLRVRDGGLLTTVHPVLWQEELTESIDQSGRSVVVGPGTMIGPLPPGRYEFDVVVGGTIVGRTTAHVQEGRLSALPIDLGAEAQR